MTIYLKQNYPYNLTSNISYVKYTSYSTQYSTLASEGSIQVQGKIANGDLGLGVCMNDIRIKKNGRIMEEINDEEILYRAMWRN